MARCAIAIGGANLRMPHAAPPNTLICRNKVATEGATIYNCLLEMQTMHRNPCDADASAYLASEPFDVNRNFFCAGSTPAA